MATIDDEQVAAVYALIDELGAVTERLRTTIDQTVNTLKGENQDDDQ